MTDAKHKLDDHTDRIDKPNGDSYVPSSTHFPQGMTAEKIAQLRAERSAEWKPTREWEDDMTANAVMSESAADPKGPMYDTGTHERELSKFKASDASVEKIDADADRIVSPETPDEELFL